MMLKKICVVAVAGVVAGSNAIAAELKNLDPEPVLLIVKSKGKAEALRLAQNESISTKENNILFIIGKQRVMAGGNELYSFQNGTLYGLNVEAKKALAAEADREAKQKKKKKHKSKK